jgi:hypothetical protein
MIFVKFTIEKNSFKIVGILMALIFGLISSYIFLRANTEGTNWVYLDKKIEIYDLQPISSESYIKEDADYYFILLENSSEPLKISKDDANIANSNDVYQNKVIKETLMKVSTKADNEFSFLVKDGEVKYETYYHIYLDY